MDKLLPFLCRVLPANTEALADMALDLRWTWNHGGDKLWEMLDPEAWQLTRNPWWILQSISQERIEKLAGSAEFQEELKRLMAVCQDYVQRSGWFKEKGFEKSLGTIAYFSMEFGLGEVLPMYAGGLGMLAGDFLKTASDLDVPVVGIGLLYQEGYFRQIIGADGWQIEAHPHNDATNLPIRPVMDASGGWLRVPLGLPGRTIVLRVWQVQVGRVTLYLLDSNDPLNNAADRSIIYKLYEDKPEFRLMLEMALGISGWRVLAALGIRPDICHLNEGHAAFAVLERARCFMQETGKPFAVALWATRAGNAFTTHTPVAAGFDTFSPDLIARYFRDYAASLGISLEQFLALGRQNPDDPSEPFNMAVLALRGSMETNAVSRLHGEVSRRIFQPLFPRWPEREVPISHVTNGVHMPSWDSKWADELWMSAGGKGCWCSTLEHLAEAIQNLSDVELWALRNRGRQELVNYVRKRLGDQFRQYGAAPEDVERAKNVLAPDLLTIGFARRFTAYKRPNLLLHDMDWLARILNHPAYPVQIVVAGKAHPHDEEGKRMIQRFVNFARQPRVRSRVVFLPDYDIAIAQQLVQGVDLWLNTPRRPWEACGTSGMKVLVNGGLNLSELDGWWAEAYTPEVGWALGDGQEHTDLEWDALEAEQIYQLLEEQLIPDFYDRDSRGVPLRWVSRIRASMRMLTPRSSSNRMLREYVEQIYLPGASRYRERAVQDAGKAEELYSWSMKLEASWPEVRFGRLQVQRKGKTWNFEVPVYLEGILPEFVEVQLYADPSGEYDVVCQQMIKGDKLPGVVNGYLYKTSLPATRPAEDFTPRIIPAHQMAKIPLEEKHILWYSAAASP
ncbi:MAG: glycosyltransferase family 1 protein [Chloroflexi bacterium]|nr:glycosyltransferase family 1 protein [Chloroflexota bacterium]